MDNNQLYLIIAIIIIAVFVSIIFTVLMTSKYATFKHEVKIINNKENEPKQEIVKEEKKEEEIIVDDKKETFEIEQKCENQSLNGMHMTGSIGKSPWKVMCDNVSEESGELFYKKYKPYRTIYTADKIEQGILGSNYMMYNTHPDPYKLDFNLYDKNEVIDKPVGINYDMTLH